MIEENEARNEIVRFKRFFYGANRSIAHEYAEGLDLRRWNRGKTRDCDN